MLHTQNDGTACVSQSHYLQAPLAQGINMLPHLAACNGPFCPRAAARTQSCCCMTGPGSFPLVLEAAGKADLVRKANLPGRCVLPALAPISFCFCQQFLLSFIVSILIELCVSKYLQPIKSQTKQTPPNPQKNNKKE